MPTKKTAAAKKNASKPKDLKPKKNPKGGPLLVPAIQKIRDARI